MPELPEVETTRRVLAPLLIGQSVREVIVHQPQVIAHPEAGRLGEKLRQQRIASLGRRGKYLWFGFSDQSRMVVHLRMTGALVVVAAGEPPEKHTHVVWVLGDGNQLRFSDPRRFGRIWYFAPGEPDHISGIHRLGPEPGPDVTGEYLRDRCGARRVPIKSCLLDQRVVAGIGNIYADETLFQAGILPSRQANTLTADEWQRLALTMPERLGFFTEKNTISAAAFFAGNGRAYRNTPHLQVYNRAGLPCRVCGTALQRTTIGGRGSVWCPLCQK